MTYRRSHSPIKALIRLTMLMAVILAAPQLHAKLVVTSTGLSEIDELTASRLQPCERSVVNTDDGVIVSYKFNYFEATEEADGYRLSLPGFFDVAVEGSPAILKRRDAFDCPQNASPTVKVLSVNSVDVRLPLSASESPVSDSGIRFFPPNTPITPYGGFLPEENVSGLNHANASYASMAWVNVSPLMYSVQDTIIRLCTELSYEITFNTPENSPKARITLPGGSLPDTTIFVQPDPGVKDHAVLYEPADEEFLIITTSNYADEDCLQKFATWKRIQGYKTKIAYKEKWSSSKQVFDTVKAHYSVNPDLRYILIIGNGLTVPTVKSGEFTAFSNISDLDYGCINGSDLPEIRRGRWPVRSLIELEAVILKTVNYEAFPPDDNAYYSEATHFAYFQNVKIGDTIISGKADQPFDRNCEDVQKHMERYTKLKINRLYSAAQDPKDVNTVYFRPQEWSDDFYSKHVLFDTVPVLRDYPWNKGYTEFVECLKTPQLYSLYRGHGFYDSWYNPVYKDSNYEILFTSSHVRSLSPNLNTSVLFSITCNTGRFLGDCLANAWLSSFGGPVAVIAQSSTGYSQINGHLTMELFNHWWGEYPIESDLLYYSSSDSRVKKSRIGDILDCALARVLMHPREDLATYTSRITHCFADPSLILHNSLPKEIEDVEVNRNESSVTVYTGAFNGYIALYDMRTKESRRFYGNYGAIKTNHPENVCVHIEKEGYYPFMSMGEDVPDEPIEEEKNNRIIDVTDNLNGRVTIHYITDENMGAPSLAVYDVTNGFQVGTANNLPKGENSYTMRLRSGIFTVSLRLPELSEVADSYTFTVQ